MASAESSIPDRLINRTPYAGPPALLVKRIRVDNASHRDGDVTSATIAFESATALAARVDFDGIPIG